MFRLAVILCLFVATAPIVPAVLVNGDFASGLTGWTADGAVAGDSGHARLSDGANGGGALLYQAVPLSDGPFLFSFDYFNELSPAVPFGSFADTFFASLYFTNDAGPFDPNTAVGMGMLDLDSSGAANVAGQLSASSLGAGWVHFSFQFTNAFDFVVPYFELFELNSTNGDSSVLIDNVAFAPIAPVIPEPATLALVGVGLAAWGAQRNARRRA